MSGPLLVAHRGGAAEAPENTRAAFRKSLALGIRWFELDVQMSRDGALMVIHDEAVDRTTNGTGRVADLTLAELQSLDAGAWFGPEYAGETVPTLRDVIDLCASAGAGIFLELKSAELYPGMVPKVASLLGEMWLQGVTNIKVISFNPEAIYAMHDISGTLNIGLLLPSSAVNFAIQDSRLWAVCPHFSLPLRFPEQVAECHRLGKHVMTWTVNEPEDMRRLAEIGVDAIVSDRPSLLLSTLG